MKEGDIVDFESVPGIRLMGMVKSFHTADVTLAKIRCVVNHKERFLYEPVDTLSPARFPQYYSEDLFEDEKFHLGI